MRSTTPQLTIASFAALFILLPGWAHAQDSARVQEAIRMFDAARDAISRGDLASACSGFEHSQRLDPQLGTQLHLADCYEKQGKLASAWLNFRAAEMLAAERNASQVVEPREKVAQLRAAKLGPRLSSLRLVLRAPAPQLTVALDDHDLPADTWGTAAPVDPGTHMLRVAAPGRTTWQQSVEIVEARHVEVLVPELPRAAIPEALPAAQVSSGAPGHTSIALQPLLGYALTGLGVFAAGAGLVLGVVTDSTVGERDRLCPGDLCANASEARDVARLTHEARSTATIANVLMIGGGLTLAAGVTLLVLTPRSSEAKVSVALNLSPHAAGLTLQGAGL